MDEIREQMDVANEINEAIAQPLGGEIYDEAELEEELAALEEESMAERFSQVSTVPVSAVGNKPAISCMYFFLFEAI